MNYTRMSSAMQVMSLFLGFCLILLLVACSDSSTIHKSVQTQKSQKVAVTPTSVTTRSVANSTPSLTPTTFVTIAQSSCPIPGMARAAAMPPMSQGTDATLIYIDNEMQGARVSSSSLYGIDIKTRKTIPIVNLSHRAIYDALVSTDGQWVVFTTTVSGTPDMLAIEMVRIDGKYQQTLYCGVGASISGINWSIDQKHIVFALNSGPSTVLEFSVLQGGAVLPLTVGNISIVTWLDNSHLYIIDKGQSYQQNTIKLDLLDTTKFYQQLQSVPTIMADSENNALFDTSIDGTKLFHAQNTGNSGTISVLPAYGGTQTTIFRSATKTIGQIRVISRYTMLVIMFDTATRQSSLYRINLDGTGLLALMANPILLNPSSQYTWSNVSRDGSFYAVKVTEQSGAAQALLVGTTANVGASVYVQHNGIGDVKVAGWTTM